MENGLITTYKYDEYGYYDGDVTTQVFNGAALMPPMCIKKAPELKEGYFYKINDNEDGWIAEEKPQSAKDCLNLIVEHEDNSHRAVELKKLMQEFCEEDAEHYRVKRGENLSWTVEEIPEKTLEEAKTDKLQDLKNKASSMLDNTTSKEVFFTSSLGFKVNGDRRSKENIEDLISNFEAQHSGSEVVSFRDYENVNHDLTSANLNILLTECVTNLQNLYQQKWNLENQLNDVTSKEELEAIKIEFTMLDFS